jgi:bifunctional oligoribonuclease and PAP phosphatase NrnA
VMNKNPKIKEILELIRGKDRFLITSHKDPDGDSIGSQLGLYRALKGFGKDVIIVNQGAMPEKYNFLDPLGLISFKNESLRFTPDAVFILECPSIERIGFVSDLLPKSTIKINIDHHQDNEQYGDINWVDTESCAVGELIYFLIEGSKLKITAEIAEDLYAAIICDTGNFRFASTTARGMKIAADLVELGASPKKIFENIFSKASPATLRLLGLTLSSLKVAENGVISYLLVTQESVKQAQARIEDSEGFVDFSLGVAGVRLGILFKEVGSEEVKISVRTQNGLDAAAFAKRFNGGGHINAAGFTLLGPLSTVVDDVIFKAAEFVHGN